VRVLKKAKKTILIFIGSIFVPAFYFRIQNDKNIKIAREVQRYVGEFCIAHSRHPNLEEFNSRFPKLTRQNDWYFWPQQHDLKLLKIQYPVNGRRDDAPGISKISEFTATIYAYVIESKCEVMTGH
jgi:hypothetical protein